MNQNILNTLTTSSLFFSIGWTLIHFLWQATAIALLVAIGLAALRNRSAQSRYLVCCVGMSAMLVLTTLTFSYYLANPNRFSYESAGVGLANGDHVEIEHAVSSAVNTETSIGSSPEPSPSNQEPAMGSTIPMLTTSQWSSFSVWSTAWFAACLPWLVLAWLVGVSILSLRMFLGLIRIRRWRLAGQPADASLNSLVQRLADRLHLNVTVQLLICSKVVVPAVVGWIRPVILLPGSMISGLTPRELESILAHELAHIRRHDYIINLVQSMVEILMFYHPAVWWLSTRIRAERENCCDDIAIEICGNRLALARALARMEELRCGQETWVVAANGASLLVRIRRIMGTPHTMTENWWPAGAMAFGSLALLVGSLFLATAQARLNIEEWAAKTIELTDEMSQDKLGTAEKHDEATDSKGPIQNLYDDTDGWGALADHSGLRSRLTLQSDNVKVGQPLLFKLEVKNFGEAPTKIELQKYAPFRVLRAEKSDGKLATFIGSTSQTAGSPLELQPGESILVWENVDAASMYLLQAGEYKFFAEGGKWAMQNLRRDSNTITFTMQEGTLTPKHQLIAKVIEILPENWEISADTQGIYLRYSESNLKKDVRSVRVEWSKDKFPADKQIGWPIPGRDREFTNVNIVYLGELSFGHVYVISLPKSTESVWPDYRKTLEQQVMRIRSQESDEE